MTFKWDDIRFIGTDRLHYYAGFGDPNPRLVSLLLQHGDDPNALSRNGETPLIVCTRISLEPVLKILLSWGADPNLPSRRQETPLHVAAANGWLAGIVLLLDAGANINGQDLEFHGQATESRTSCRTEPLDC